MSCGKAMYNQTHNKRIANPPSTPTSLSIFSNKIEQRVLNGFQQVAQTVLSFSRRIYGLVEVFHLSTTSYRVVFGDNFKTT